MVDFYFEKLFGKKMTVLNTLYRSIPFTSRLTTLQIQSLYRIVIQILQNFALNQQNDKEDEIKFLAETLI